VIRIVSIVLAAALATPAEVQLAQLVPGTWVGITTRAVEQVELSGVSARHYRDDMGSGVVGTGVSVKGGSSTREGKRLWRIRPNDGSRPILFPTGHARVVGELVAVESGFVIVKENGGAEVAIPLEGVDNAAQVAKLSKGTQKLTLAVVGALAGGALFMLMARPKSHYIH
jgi:hypothetical protein